MRDRTQGSNDVAGDVSTVLDADEQLERDLTALFCRFTRGVPDDTIAAIDHAEYAEDGRTFVLSCTTTAGDMLMVQATPGKPLSVAVIEESTGFARGARSGEPR